MHACWRPLPRPQVPLVLATDWSQASKPLLTAALASLKAHGYRVVLRDEMLGAGKQLPELSREEAALLDYHLALGCHQFIGNSVSSFSAMIILERWERGCGCRRAWVAQLRARPPTARGWWVGCRRQPCGSCCWQPLVTPTCALAACDALGWW